MTAIEAVRGDITTQHVDAIVNAANSWLLGGGGVDGAIHSAGGPAILDACRELRRTTLPNGLPTGAAVATTAGRLPATHVIHTVGPVWSAREDRSRLLASAYRESLLVAEDLGATSIAFPAVSAGVYGWPMEDAARIAVDTLHDYLHERADPGEGADRLTLVRFVLFSESALAAFRAALHRDETRH
ncbi:MAG: O-acetyl-ADP-ribose deacetylase [Terrimesophilobacter sp.]